MLQNQPAQGGSERNRITMKVVELRGGQLLTGEYPLKDRNRNGLDIGFFKAQIESERFQRSLGEQRPKPQVPIPLSVLLNLDVRGRWTLEDALPAPVGTVFAIKKEGAGISSQAVLSDNGGFIRGFGIPEGTAINGQPIDWITEQRALLFMVDLFSFDSKQRLMSDDSSGAPILQCIVTLREEAGTITFKPVSADMITATVLQRDRDKYVFELEGFGKVSMPAEGFVGLPVVDSFSQWGNGAASLTFSTRRTSSGIILASETLASGLVRASWETYD